MKFGLLGERLSHSFSPEIHRLFGAYDYSLFEVAPEDLAEFLLKRDFDGINVTIPYKKAVIPYLSSLSPEAERIGSVNTIKKLPDGSLKGFNTDYDGFKSLCLSSKIVFEGRKALILGNGGAAPAVRAVLEDLGAGETVTISRKGENNYENLNLHSDAQIIVNTTPVGMYPKNGESLINLDNFPKLEGLLDIVYNPLRTKLVIDGESRKIPSFGGLLMLTEQARKASEIFTGKEIAEEKSHEAYETLLAKKENIVLIGMPGCGKSTTGRLISDMTGRPFSDTDTLVEKKIGMSIPQFLAEKGEEAFRAVETAVLREITKVGGQIIATGGGVVTQSENYPMLRQNGRIFFIKREIGNLSTKNRPLSQARPLQELAAERIPIYEAWCDDEVDFGEDSYEAAKTVIERCEI